MGFPHFLLQKMIDFFHENIMEDSDSCQAAAEVCDQYLISMRLDSGPRDEDTSWRSGKKINHFTFFNTKCLV